MLQSSKHTGAKQEHKVAIQGHMFWSQWKGDQGLSNNKLKLALFVKVLTMERPQLFVYERSAILSRIRVRFRPSLLVTSYNKNILF